MFSSISHLASKATGTSNSTPAEPSLTTILSTPALRTELTLLVGNIAAEQRKALEQTFSALPTAQLDTTVENASLQQSEATARRKSAEAREAYKEKGEDRAWVDAVKADIAAQEKIRAELEKRKKELSTDRIKEMRRKALADFDEWREKMMMRVGEVVNARDGEASELVDSGDAKGEVQLDKSQDREVQSVKDEREVKEALERVFPPVETSLLELEQAKKALILHSMLLLMLSLEHYSSWSRVLMLRLTTSLGLPLRLLEQDEAKIATGLLHAVDMSGDHSTKKAAEENAFARTWKVGLATVAGAAVIGITGGLAAPLLAAGVGSVMGGIGLGATATAGYLGTLAGSTVLVGGLFGAYGGKMTGEMMDAYAREVEDFGFVPVQSSSATSSATVTSHGKHSSAKSAKEDKSQRRLRVTIGVSGWLSSEEDVSLPWTVLGPTSAETFALRFELKALLALGNALTNLISSAAWSYAKSEIIKRTVFASISAALWPLALLKVSRVIDNPFSVAKARADKAGEVLADAIIHKAQGERPVTLIGYSLGARVIFIALKKMAERGAFGLVEDVILLGAPTPSDALTWRLVRAVAAGRVVNVYSTEDYILGFLYRSSSVQLGVAGLQAIDGVEGVENIDFSAEVQGHTRWRYMVGKTLRKVGVSDLVQAELDRQVKEGKKIKEEEERNREKAEKEDTGDEAQKLGSKVEGAVAAKK